MEYEVQEKYLSLQPFVENISEYFSTAETIVHRARNEIRLVNYEDNHYMVKAFKVPNILNRFVYRFLRASKAQRSYTHSVHIGSDICPEAIAYVEQYKYGLLDTSYYISQNFAADYTIRSVLRDKSFNHRDNILEQFALFTLSLHEKNILHKDYSPGNILVKESKGGYQFKIVDVNRMIFRPLNRQERVQNFVKLMMDEETAQIVLSRYAMATGVSAGLLMTELQQQNKRFLNQKQLKRRLRGY